MLCIHLNEAVFGEVKTRILHLEIACCSYFLFLALGFERYKLHPHPPLSLLLLCCRRSHSHHHHRLLLLLLLLLLILLLPPPPPPPLPLLLLFYFSSPSSASSSSANRSEIHDTADNQTDTQTDTQTDNQTDNQPLCRDADVFVFGCQGHHTITHDLENNIVFQPSNGGGKKPLKHQIAECRLNIR